MKRNDNFSRHQKSYQDLVEKIKQDQISEEAKNHINQFCSEDKKEYFLEKEGGVRISEQFLEKLFSDDETIDCLIQDYIDKSRRNNNSGTGCISFLTVEIAGKILCFVALSTRKLWSEKLQTKIRNLCDQFDEAIFLEGQDSNFSLLINKVSGALLDNRTFKACAEKSILTVLAKLLYQHGDKVNILSLQNFDLLPYPHRDRIPKLDIETVVNLLKNQKENKKAIFKTKSCCNYCIENKNTVCYKILPALVDESKIRKTESFGTPIREHINKKSEKKLTNVTVQNNNKNNNNNNNNNNNQIDKIDDDVKTLNQQSKKIINVVSRNKKNSNEKKEVDTTVSQSQQGATNNHLPIPIKQPKNYTIVLKSEKGLPTKVNDTEISNNNQPKKYTLVLKSEKELPKEGNDTEISNNNQLKNDTSVLKSKKELPKEGNDTEISNNNQPKKYTLVLKSERELSKKGNDTEITNNNQIEEISNNQTYNLFASNKSSESNQGEIGTRSNRNKNYDKSN